MDPEIASKSNQQKISYIIWAVFIVAAGLYLYFRNQDIDRQEQANELFTSNSEPASIKYTDEEIADFISTFRKVQDIYKKEPQTFTSEMTKAEISELSIYWNQSWGQFIEAKIDSSKKEFLLQKQKAINSLKSYQVKAFPYYRAAFAEYAGKVLWEHDCEAKVSGPGNTLLTLSGNAFLANKNKQAIHDQLLPMLQKYRFKKLRFKWFMNAEEYYDYQIESEKDDASISI